MAPARVDALLPASLAVEGPTPGALQELLDNIDKASEQSRTDLFFSMLRGVSGGAAPDEAALKAMTRLEAASCASGTEQWVAQVANRYLEMQQHVAALQAELRAAQAAADLESTLREFRALLEDGRFSSAARRLADLRKALDAAAGQGGGKACQLDPDHQTLAEACAGCARDLEEALESGLAEAFECLPERGLLSISATLPSGTDLADVWEAMELAGSADRHLGAIAGTLLRDVLPHVLSGAATLHTHAAPDGTSAQVQWAAAAPGECRPPGAVEQDVVALLHVLADVLLRQRSATLRTFGAALWPGFVAAYQAWFLGAVQAGTASATNLQARQAAAREMEARALELGLADPGSDLASCLTRAVRASYHAAQEAHLAEARALLLSHDPAAEPVVVGQPLPLDVTFYSRYKSGQAKAWELLDPPSGWDTNGPVLAAGYYSISSTALQLVMSMDDALAHACHEGEPAAAQAAAGAVCKMAALFTALLPAPPAADAPALALQRHNDATYIADHLLLLPYLFGAELEGLLGGPLWLGGDALRLRGAARAALADAISVQTAALRETLLPLLQLSAALASGKPPAAKDAEAAAKTARGGALHTLRRAGRLLWGGLAPGVALDASLRLLEALAGALVADVLAKRDIGEVEAGELLRLYRPVAEEAVVELLADADLDGQITPTDAGFNLKDIVAAALPQRCSELRRLRAVLGLLDARLSDIVAAWEAGSLSAAGLALHEVGRLVMALFEDTDYRAQCLQRMEVAQP